MGLEMGLRLGLKLVYNFHLGLGLVYSFHFFLGLVYSLGLGLVYIFHLVRVRVRNGVETGVKTVDFKLGRRFALVNFYFMHLQFENAWA